VGWGLLWEWLWLFVGLHGHRPKYMMWRTQNVSRPASSFRFRDTPAARAGC
jgi:hypothetical protein